MTTAVRNRYTVEYSSWTAIWGQIPEPSQHQRRARQAEYQEQCRQYAEIERAKERAERRARKLLRQSLTPAQRTTLRRNRWIEVVGNQTGHTYRIDCHVEVENIQDRTTGQSYCLVLGSSARNDWAEEIPRSDHLLAQKLAIETNEKRFRRIAFRMARF